MVSRTSRCRRFGCVRHTSPGWLVAFFLSVLVGGALCLYVLYAYAWDPKQEFCMTVAWDTLRACTGGGAAPLPTDKLDRTGKPILSWRRIGLSIDPGARLGDPNAPWNAPANYPMAMTGFPTFCFMNPPGIICELFPSYYPQTRVLAITGPDTAFDPDREISLKYLPPNLILLVEVWGTGINWLQPEDIDVRDYRLLRMDGRHGRGCWVLFADGILAFVRSDVPLENVKRFCTITSAKKSNREELLGPFIVRAVDLSRGAAEAQRPLNP